MADQLATAPPRVKTHGILALHGAGTPPDTTTIVGDTLAMIANGLADFIAQAPALQARYRATVRAEVVAEKRTTKQVTVDLYKKGEAGKAEEHAAQIRLREVLWKPVMPKRGLFDYIPLLWLWAFTFQAQTSRKIESLNMGPAKLETETESARRRRSNFWGRITLAGLGLAATGAWVWIAREVFNRFNFKLPAETLGLLRAWLIPGVFGASIVAAVLLALLAAEEWRSRSRKNGNALGRLHMTTIIAATAWLGLFLLPFLLLAYYADRVLNLILILGVAALPAIAALNWGFGWQSAGFLVLFAFMLWLVTRDEYKENVSARISSVSRENMQTFLANLVTNLLVATGAPLSILFISVIEFLAAVPVFGDGLSKWAKSMAENGFWEVLKDIHMFLIDSTRAAAARAIVEQGILDLQPADLDAIHIFSHSLGTVVAYDTLVHLGRDAGALIRKDDPVHQKIKSLVTYGSPLNKVRMLANKATEAAQCNPPMEIMAGLDCTRFDDHATLPQDRRGFRWLNHFSPHDFVSDTLTQYHRAEDPDSRGEDPTIPHEYWTPSANDLLTAHGAYWNDAEFWRVNLTALGILPDAPAASANAAAQNAA